MRKKRNNKDCGDFEFASQPRYYWRLLVLHNCRQNGAILYASHVIDGNKSRLRRRLADCSRRGVRSRPSHAQPMHVPTT